MRLLDQALQGPILSPQGSACGQRDWSKLSASAYGKLDIHYLLQSPREGSHVPAGDVPEKTGM